MGFDPIADQARDRGVLFAYATAYNKWMNVHAKLLENGRHCQPSCLIQLQFDAQFSAYHAYRYAKPRDRGIWIPRPDYVPAYGATYKVILAHFMLLSPGDEIPYCPRGSMTVHFAKLHASYDMVKQQAWGERINARISFPGVRIPQE